MSKHKWKTIGEGNYWTEHQCTQCKEKWVSQWEDIRPSPEGGLPPIDGCKGHQALPSSKSVQLKDHQIAQMVNELTEVAQKFGYAQCVREKLRTVVLKHLKPL